MKNRTSSYRRHKRWAKINRKKNIVRDHHDYFAYKFEGQLDKGKIHCSCPLCRAKYSDGAHSMQDIRRLMSMADSTVDIGVSPSMLHKVVSRMRQSGIRIHPTLPYDCRVSPTGEEEEIL